MSALLLDTCTVIWLAMNRLPPPMTARIDEAAARGEVYYSAISAWEIGLLGRPRKDGPRLRFEPDPVVWFERFRMGPGLREIELSASIALAASLLPVEIHSDPADRVLIATARDRGIPLLTNDRRIIDYAAQGLLDVIACCPEDAR